MVPRNPSCGIFRLASWLRAIGVEVELYADLGGTVAGRYRSPPSRVLIDEPDAWEALVTIAHEAGHHLSYQRRGREAVAALSKPERERLAYLYGWAVLVAADCAALVDKAGWRSAHSDVLGAA